MGESADMDLLCKDEKSANYGVKFWFLICFTYNIWCSIFLNKDTHIIN